MFDREYGQADGRQIAPGAPGPWTAPHDNQFIGRSTGRLEAGQMAARWEHRIQFHRWQTVGAKARMLPHSRPVPRTSLASLQTSDQPVLRDIVLVGGGHSHVGVIKRFGMRPVPGTLGL